MSIEDLGDGLSYHLISFDARGRERPDDPGGRMSDVIADAVRTTGVTDVFLFSHGWRGDLGGARRQYENWVRAMGACAEDRQDIRRRRPGFTALLVGVHWPSEPFGREDFGDESFAAGAELTAPEGVDAATARWAARLDVDGEAEAALRTILWAAADDPVPPELPDAVRDAYVTLDRSLDLGSRGVGAEPGADREPFDPDTAYANALDDEADFAGGFGFGDLLTPLKQLSFWRMKARARTVGETGGRELLDRLMESRDGVRFHLMGHSFGCIVVSSMITAGAGRPRQVSSLSLVQGAVSLWSYCTDIPRRPGTPGYFQGLLARHDVAGPVLATHSVHDRAVGFWYPKAAGIGPGDIDFAPGEFPAYGGIGSFGMQGPGTAATSVDMGDGSCDYDFRPGRAYNVRADDRIVGGDFFSGSHSQIANPAVAHAVWRCVIAAP